MSEYHVPVMAKECLEALITDPDGLYVDATFGGGGHARLIVAALNKGHLYAFDQDQDAVVNSHDIAADKFTLIEANFRHLKQYLKFHGIKKVQGILADFGVSSHQINEAKRGFSTRFEGPLDMRMNQNQKQSAADFIQNASEVDLHKIFGMYGEIRNARTLAQAVASARVNQKIETTTQLKNVINQYAPRGSSFQYFAQVFQALRIAVNEELVVIQEFLAQSAEVLAPNGRLVLLSYHSLEDRLAKNYISKGNFDGQDAVKDIYGNTRCPFEPLVKKAQQPSAEELQQNPRARSAKLRVGVRKP